MDLAKMLGLNTADVALLINCAVRATEAIEQIADDIRKVREDQELK